MSVWTVCFNVFPVILGQTCTVVIDNTQENPACDSAFDAKFGVSPHLAKPTPRVLYGTLSRIFNYNHKNWKILNIAPRTQTMLCLYLHLFVGRWVSLIQGEEYVILRVCCLSPFSILAIAKDFNHG